MAKGQTFGRRGQLIGLINCLIGTGSVGLVGIYGSLHWWLRSAQQMGMTDKTLSIQFLNRLDWMPAIGAMTAAFALISNLILWKAKMLSRCSGLVCTAYVALCLCACLIRF